EFKSLKAGGPGQFFLAVTNVLGVLTVGTQAVCFVCLNPGLGQRDARVPPHSELPRPPLSHVPIDPCLACRSNAQVKVVAVVQQIFFWAGLGRSDLSLAQ